MSIENILAELIAALKCNTAAINAARDDRMQAEAQVSTGSMLIDKTDEERQAEKPVPAVTITAEETKTIKFEEAEGAVHVVVEDAKPIEPEGDPEAIVDKASAAYSEMKDAVLAVARKDKNQAVAILAEFGIAKMTEAKNKDVSTITTKMRIALLP